MSWDKALALDESAPSHTPPTASARETEPGPPAPRRRSSSSRSSRAARRRRQARGNQRLDIQGLRAVAVLAVVVNHLVDWPRGGFVGVDVFFVISGYLITSLMLREEGRSGHISLLAFYRRRVKRLMPAALMVTVSTVVAAWLVFGAGRGRSVLVDGLWATGFAANWRMVATGTDYFASYGPISPLRHYWSLSVEEQFYLVWPVTLILAFAIARRMRLSRSTATYVSTAVAAAVLTLGSLAVAVVQTSSSPVVAYFSTFTRGWELGIGAVLAIVVPRLSVPRRVLTAMSWTGLAVIGVSLFVVGESGMPFPGAVAPCLGAALVVAAFSRGESGRNVLLTNRIACYIGDISYSVYLVHFPVIIVGLALLPDPTAADYVTLLLLTAGLSVLSYHLVENPLRSRPWTLRRFRSTTRHGKFVHQPWRDTDSLRKSHALVAACAFLVAAGALSAVAAPQQSVADRTREQVAAALQTTSTPSASASGTGAAGAQDDSLVSGPATDALQQQLRAALTATSWPALNPAFDQVSGEPNKGCPSGPLPPASTCTWGNSAAGKTVYLVGDSTSAAYFGAFSTLIQNHPDWKMRLGAGAGCPFAARQVNEGDEGNVHTADCPGRNAALVAEIQQVKPDLVVFTTTRGSDAFISAIEPELELIRPSVKQLVVLAAPPHITDPNDCYTSLSKPADCITPVPAEYAGWVSNEAKLAADLDGTFLNTTPWFCVNGYCPSFAGTTPQRKDGVHLTYDYSTMIAPAVDETLTARKFLD